MKLSLKIIAAAALGLAGPAMAQSSTATATATASVIQPISVTKATDLSFGAFVRPATGANTIAINSATGTRSLTGGGNGALTASSTSRAAFTVGGEGAQTFSITVPPTVSITRAGGTETLPVTLSASGATGALSGTVGGDGTATFGVGGTLPLDSSVVGGSYSGAFDVTVGYN